MTAHSEKQNAVPTFKRGFGFHPLCSFADHGQDGTGEPLSVLLRPGNAGSNTAVDHITVARDALRQLPFTARGGRVGRKVLIRTDSAGTTHEFLDWLHARRLSYSVGFTLPDDAVERLARIPRPGVDTRLRRRPQTPGWSLGGRGHRRAGPHRVATRDAGHRPQGTTPPRSPVAVHRCRWPPTDRLRHQHHSQTARRSGAAPPPSPAPKTVSAPPNKLG